jgi:ABC-type nitrate/sulfonate/bicarbonate transport system permease component
MTMQAVLRRTARIALPLILPIIIIAAMWIATTSVKSVYFPPLPTVLKRLWSGLTSGKLLALLGYSLGNLLIGLVIASIVGIGLGLVLGTMDTTRRVLMPILNFGRSMPHVAFVPVIILTLGIGSLPKIVLIAMSTMWVILLNTISGVRGINPAVLETAACYRIPGRLKLTKVILPGALPQILAGLRIAVAVGLVVVIIGELYGSANGIGYFIQASAQNFVIVDTWAGTILIGIVGYLLSMLLLLAEHLLLGWFYERPPRERRTRPHTPIAPATTSAVKEGVPA